MRGGLSSSGASARRIMYELLCCASMAAAGRSSYDKRAALRRKNSKATTHAWHQPLQIRRFDSALFGPLKGGHQTPCSYQIP